MMNQRQISSYYPSLFLFAVFLLLFGTRLDIVHNLASFAPYFDDWGMGGTLQEHKSGELTLKFLMTPTNGHLGLWREFLQIGLFDLNQEQWDPLLQMVANSFIWAITGTFLIAIIQRWFDVSIAPGLTFLVLAVWVFPASLINATWGVQTHNYFMVAFTVTGLWFITSPVFKAFWWLGVFLLWAVTLTMGGGALVAPVVFGVTIFYLVFGVENYKKQHKITAISMLLLSLYCVWLLGFSSGNHNVYYATTFGDFASVMLKALSYPLEKKVWPSVIFALPIMILAWRVFIAKTVNGRPAQFALLLYGFSFALAFTVGYARGGGGWDPSPRYFDFFVLKFLASFMALLLISPKLNQGVGSRYWTSLLLVWFMIGGYGVVNQFRYLNHEIGQRAIYKPLQEQTLRNYIINRDREPLAKMDPRIIPFASGLGLAFFVEKVDKEPIWSADLQVPVFLQASQNEANTFIKNGVNQSSSINGQVQYQGEDVWGSYTHETDKSALSKDLEVDEGFLALGRFVSDVIEPSHSYLQVPISGFTGYPGMSLKLIDQVTQEETMIQPSVLHKNFIGVWRKVTIKTPKNPFRIVAEDTSQTMWMAFAAPRVLGTLSAISNELLNQSKRLWKIALLLLLVLSRKRIVGMLQLSK